MKICHVDPGCGLTIPPKDWGAIEKIIWEFEVNQTVLGHEVFLIFTNYMIIMFYIMVKILMCIKKI